LARPEQIEHLQAILASTKQFLQTNRESLSSQSPPPIEEDNLDDDEPTPSTPPASLFQLDEKAIETLDSVVKEVDMWLTEKLGAQEKLQLWEEPVLLLTDLEKKSNQIQSALRKIIIDSAKQKTTKSTTASATGKTTMSSKESVSSSVPTPEVYIEVIDDEEEEEDSAITTTATVTSTIIVDDTSSSSTTTTSTSSKAEKKHEEL